MVADGVACALAAGLGSALRLSLEGAGGLCASDLLSPLFQVDCALSLIRLGVERHIPGLLALCDDLVTLETLVYEAGCDLTLTLKELQQMKDIEKLRLLMESVGFILTVF